MADYKDIIKLTDMLPGKGPNIALWSSNVELIEKFKFLCKANLSTELGWFHQCNSQTYQMFEFWRPQSPAMTEYATRIAEALDLPLKMELVRDYQLGREITMKEFEPFNPDMHTPGDFFGS